MQPKSYSRTWFHGQVWQVLKPLTLTVLAGSLVDLLASVPAHLVVIRRPGCLVGLGTAAGIAAGICAMLWAFGPGIVLLFFRERYRAERERDASHGDGRKNASPPAAGLNRADHEE